jgi:hypothetical protein
MNQKCGLVNKSNPCRCDKKTKSFIEAGWVDKDNLKFNTAYVKTIAQIAPQKVDELLSLETVEYIGLFKKLPFQEKQHDKKLFDNVFIDNNIKGFLN